MSVPCFDLLYHALPCPALLGPDCLCCCDACRCCLCCVLSGLGRVFPAGVYMLLLCSIAVLLDKHGITVKAW